MQLCNNEQEEKFDKLKHEKQGNDVFWKGQVCTIKSRSSSRKMYAYVDQNIDENEKEPWVLVLAYAHTGGESNDLRPGVTPFNPDYGYSHMDVDFIRKKLNIKKTAKQYKMIKEVKF